MSRERLSGEGFKRKKKKNGTLVTFWEVRVGGEVYV